MRSTKIAPDALSTSYLTGSASLGISMTTLMSSGTLLPAGTRSRPMGMSFGKPPILRAAGRAGMDTRFRFSAGAVVVAAGNDLQLPGRDAIDEAVGVVDTARPAAREFAPQWLGFADTPERITLAGANQCIDAFQRFAILALPVEILLPGFGVK